MSSKESSKGSIFKNKNEDRKVTLRETGKHKNEVEWNVELKF